MITVHTLIGSSPRGYLTGPELSALVRRVRGVTPEGGHAIGEEAANLMSMALEPRTWTARSNHMAALGMFMVETKRDFPLEMRDLVAFVGFLYSRLIRGVVPKISGASLANYISGVRLTHADLGLGELPPARSCMMLKAASAGYRKAYDAEMPPKDMRIAIPPDVLYQILVWAERPEATRVEVRNASLVITATVFGLRAAGAESILRETIDLDPERLQVLVNSLKARTREAARRRGARSFYAPDPVPGHPRTVLELVNNWLALRGSAEGPLFDADGLHPCSLDDATKRVVAAVGYEAPDGCAVRGHSPRISAFSQAALMQWDVVRLKIRFDWKNLDDMSDVYMDHRQRTSAASRVFFSPKLPEPPTGENAGP